MRQTPTPLSILAFSLAMLQSPISAFPQGQDAKTDDGTAILTPTHLLSGHSRLVRCLAFAPNGVLASGGQDRLICLWSKEGKRIRCVDLRPDGG